MLLATRAVQVFLQVGSNEGDPVRTEYCFRVFVEVMFDDDGKSLRVCV